MPVAVTGPPLAAATCARRLAPLGFRPANGGSATAGVLASDVEDASVEVDITWFGTADYDEWRGSEATVQAVSGLMAVHGRDSGGPRRIGLEVASVAAGILAAHAVVAGLVGHRRGNPLLGVGTSALDAALLANSHRIAADSTGEEWVPAPDGPAPGPPFVSADGHTFELETLDPTAWRAFWNRLGGGDADLEWAWRLFRPRYFRGTCTLPDGLHDAVRARQLREVAAAADACDVSLSRVRLYDEVLDDLGPLAGHPDVRSLTGSPPRHPRPRDQGGGGDLPLAGLRVVEATSRLQGPLAGLLLHMLGAEVVLVEPPVGAFTRAVPPLVDGTGTFFLCFNRGKQTVEVDLGRPEGRAALRDLIADADVFLHNWRPGKAAEWSLDAADLAAVNPRLVHATASGWGEDPALSRLLGTDYLVQAHAGVGAGIVPDGEPPAPSRALLTDYLGALVTAEAVLWGLYRREQTGMGQRVGASLLGGAMALQAHVVEALADGREKGRRGGRAVWGVLDRPLPTADGAVVVSVDDDSGVRRLARACGVDPDRLGDEPLERAVAGRLVTRPAAHWEERLVDAGIACAAAATDLAALPRDPRLAGSFEPLGGEASVPARPWRLRR